MARGDELSLGTRADIHAMALLREMGNSEHLVFGPFVGRRKEWMLRYGHGPSPRPGETFDICMIDFGGFTAWELHEIWKTVVQNVTWIRPTVKVHYVAEHDHVDALCERLFPYEGEYTEYRRRFLATLPHGPELTRFHFEELKPDRRKRAA